jgi:hypothetical protein
MAASVAFGLIMTNRMARVWPGGPTAFDLHQFTSLLGLAFAVFRGLILLGDQYIKYTVQPARSFDLLAFLARSRIKSRAQVRPEHGHGHTIEVD